MTYRTIDEHPRTYVIVFETGDELAAGLTDFARKERLSAASFKAVGAFSSVRLAWFDWERKRYEPCVAFDEQVELLSLIGAVREGRDGVQRKSPRSFSRGGLFRVKIMPAATYSPTQFPVQYHRRYQA